MYHIPTDSSLSWHTPLSFHWGFRTVEARFNQGHSIITELTWSFNSYHGNRQGSMYQCTYDICNVCIIMFACTALFSTGQPKKTHKVDGPLFLSLYLSCSLLFGTGAITTAISVPVRKSSTQSESERKKRSVACTFFSRSRTLLVWYCVVGLNVILTDGPSVHRILGLFDTVK